MSSQAITMTIDEPEGDSAANAPTSTASIDDGETHSHDTDDSDLSVGKGGSDSIGIPGDPVPLDPDHSIAGDPAEAPSLCDAAAGLVESGDFAEAIIGYRRAISLDPAFAPGYAGLGIALEAKGHIGAAIAAVRRSLAISPDNATAHANLGRLLKIKGEFREAALCWFRAIELDAGNASFHLGLGIALRDMGLAAESVLSLQKARELAPDQPDILYEAGQAEVLLGHISTGFAGVAARTKLTDSTSPQHDGPNWTGEDISGKTILVYADGRLSETLMLSRFVTELARRGATVLLECQAPLVGMLSTLSGVSRALPRGDIVPNYDVKVALIELPALLELDTNSRPA
ncbi:MAG: tetratricopeptide repeat protein, partial [Pseudomonadota bacterium]